MENKDKRKVEEAFKSFHATELVPRYSYQQQDVHEVFLALLDRYYTSLERSTFQFIEITQRDCKCRSKPVFNTAFCLSLAVADTLEDALKAWTKTETLDEPCRACHGPQKQRLAVQDSPRVIVLHLKLFTPSSKVKRSVVYPLVNLDLTPLLLPQDEVYYELQAVIRHIGDSKDRGHYIAWVKSKNQWFSCNDQAVRRIDPSAHRNPPSDAGNPYLFFYKQQEEKAESFSWEELQRHLTQLGGKPADMKPPPGFKLEPHRHQIEALQFMLGRERVRPPKSTGGFLCSDVGTGKSLEVAMLIVANQASKEFIADIHNSPATLLVCPNSLVSQWTCFLQEYYDFTVYHFQRKKGKNETACIRTLAGGNIITDLHKLPLSSVIIISWDVLNVERKYLNAREGGRTQKRDQSISLLKHYAFWRMVLDEGHVYHKQEPPGVEAEHQWYITGTPILEDTVQPALAEVRRLLKLLQIEDKCLEYWSSTITKPFISGDQKPLISLLREYMWTHSIQNLDLPAAESHFIGVPLNAIEFDTYTTAKSLNHTRMILSRLCNHLEASEQENAVALLKVRQAKLVDVELKLYSNIIEFGKHCSPTRRTEARKLVEIAYVCLDGDGFFEILSQPPKTSNPGKQRTSLSILQSLLRALGEQRSSSSTTPAKKNGLLQPLLSIRFNPPTIPPDQITSDLRRVDQKLEAVRIHCEAEAPVKRRRKVADKWKFVEGWYAWLTDELKLNLLHITTAHRDDQKAKDINERHAKVIHESLLGIDHTSPIQQQFQDGFRLCLEELNSTGKPKESATAAIDSLRWLWDWHKEITDSRVNRLCQHCLVPDQNVEREAEELIASLFDQVQKLRGEYQQKRAKFAPFLKCQCGTELDVIGDLKRDNRGAVYCGKCPKSPKTNFEIPGCLTKKKIGEAEKYNLSKTRIDYLATQSSSKCKAVGELLKNLKEEQPNAKVLCFSHHPWLLAQLGQSVKYVTVAPKGDISDETLNNFKRASGFRVLALPYGSGHCGLDLSISSIAVLCEPTRWIWEKQAEGRIRRIGQTVSKVRVYHLYAKDTLEEELVKAHQNRCVDPETESECSDSDTDTTADVTASDDAEDDDLDSPLLIYESPYPSSSSSTSSSASSLPGLTVSPEPHTPASSPTKINQANHVSASIPLNLPSANMQASSHVIQRQPINDDSSEAEVATWLTSWLPSSDKLPELPELLTLFSHHDGKTLLAMGESDKEELSQLLRTVLTKPQDQFGIPRRFWAELNKLKADAPKL